MIRACVFDAYGTLFDVAAAARSAARGQPWEGLWPKLAADWRRKQLEYSWLRAVSGTHTDFWQVTQDALDWALEAAGLADPALRARLLALYHELAAFPEVPDMLAALAGQGRRRRPQPDRRGSGGPSRRPIRGTPHPWRKSRYRRCPARSPPVW